MPKKYKVNKYELTGGALDTFYKLFWFGSQDDGGLPSKDGMYELVRLKLAQTDYELPKIMPGQEANALTIKGQRIAQDYHHKSFCVYRDFWVEQHRNDKE